MQKRQYKILKLLYRSDGFVTVERLAADVQCSLIRPSGTTSSSWEVFWKNTDWERLSLRATKVSVS